MSELNTAELRLKLENLERRKREVQAEKKRDNKLKNDEIKEIDDEIGYCLEDLDEINLTV
jgi:phosphopantetheine adenylyltransferase